jgi:hypothetical protein
MDPNEMAAERLFSRGYRSPDMASAMALELGITHIVGRPTNIPDIDLATPCTLWDGELDRDGYGRSGNGSAGSQVAHVREWEEATDTKLPEGTSLDHLCLNRECINIKHLDLVTWDENSRRRWQK